MKSALQQLISRVLALLIAFLGIPWALHPFFSPPQGIYPFGWTYAQLIRDRYPIHLVNPAWLSNDLLWGIRESEVRLGVVLLTVVSLFIFANWIENETGHSGH
jgi:hypothetical protein